jgi:hypothetical protein
MTFGRVGSAPAALAMVVVTLVTSGCGAKSTAMPPVGASQMPYTVGELKRVFARAGITVFAFPIPPVFVGTSDFSTEPVVYLVVVPTARQAHGVGMKKYLRSFDADFAHALTERSIVRNVEILIPAAEPAQAHQQVLAAAKSL